MSAMEACGMNNSDAAFFDDESSYFAHDGGQLPPTRERSIATKISDKCAFPKSPDAESKFDLKDWVEYDVIGDLNG